MLRRLGTLRWPAHALPQLLPSLGKMPLNSTPKAALHAKANAVASAPPYIHPALTLFEQPEDADPFAWTSNPAPAYPAPGQGSTIVLSYTVPRSKLMVIQKIAIIHVGGNPPDFTGNVIWRVLRNGGGRGASQSDRTSGHVRGSTVMRLIGIENDTFVVTVELPLAAPAMPVGTSTAAAFYGFTYPLSEATYPQQGTY